MTTIIDDDNSDLLILSDEDSNIDSFLLNETDNSQDNLSNNELITFEDNSDFDLWSGLIVDEKLELINDNFNSDFSLDNNDLSFSDLNNDKKDEILSDNNSLTNFDLSNNTELIEELQTNSLSSNNQNIPSFPIENSVSVWTMFDILNKAINEMTSRSDIIANEIETEDKHIWELKEKILNLEWQVMVSEWIVSELKDENNLISKNVKSLEKMKSIESDQPIQKVTTNTKTK